MFRFHVYVHPDSKYIWILHKSNYYMEKALKVNDLDIKSEYVESETDKVK
jgi:hypothetical protein